MVYSHSHLHVTPTTNYHQVMSSSEKYAVMSLVSVYVSWLDAVMSCFHFPFYGFSAACIFFERESGH